MEDSSPRCLGGIVKSPEVYHHYKFDKKEQVHGVDVAGLLDFEDLKGAHRNQLFSIAGLEDGAPAVDSIREIDFGIQRVDQNTEHAFSHDASALNIPNGDDLFRFDLNERDAKRRRQ